MEEDFDINAFIDEHVDEDLDALTIFIPDELKVESDEDQDDLGKYDQEELHKSTLDLVAAVHLTDDRITRDAAIAIYPTTNSKQDTLSYVGSWFDYYTQDGRKYCNEVNLYLEITDLSDWSYEQADVLEFDSLKNSKSANARKIYSSLINRVL
jgi:lysophospholipase L1-like esterase